MDQKVKMSCYFFREDFDKILRLAEKENRNTSEMIRVICKRYLSGKKGDC